MALHARTLEIRQFIVGNVSQHPADIARLTAGEFQISRQAVHRHLRELVKNGTLAASGRGRARRYSLRPLVKRSWELEVTPDLEEHVPWRDWIRPLLDNVPANVLDICNYGFTEILNNVKDHSESRWALVDLLYTPESISLSISDHGVGIFRKIKKEAGLAHEHEAIAELAKGKFTTDPDRHTGEGIFFTSRIFGQFTIVSGNLVFLHRRSDDDGWLLESQEQNVQGTSVTMVISLRSKTSLKDVFERFAADPDGITFSRTHVPLKLSQYTEGGKQSLVSRSQARRVLSRFDRFEEVLLDFEGVEYIGQAFADEVFRVFQNEHPEVQIVAMRTNRYVQGMINRARLRRHQQASGAASTDSRYRQI